MDTTRPSLLLRIRNPTDGRAWGEFDAIYRPLLIRYARARGLDDATSEDVAQLCLAAVHEHIGGFDYDPSRGKFKGYLRTLVNNRFRNLLRDNRDERAQTQDFNRPQEREQSAEELFDSVWQEELLRHAMKQVREEVEPATFEAFVAYAVEEQPIEAVCTSFNMNANQVHAIKYRMTKRLAAKMRELACED